MDWSTVQFCPDIQGMRDKISQFVAHDVFQSQSEDFKNILKKRYAQMEEGCRKGWGYDDENWNLSLDGKTYRRISRRAKRDVLLKLQGNDVPSSDNLIKKCLTKPDFGHDMPVWIISNSKTPSRKVMMVARDPQRTNDSDNGLTLSTPWSLEF